MSAVTDATVAELGVLRCLVRHDPPDAVGAARAALADARARLTGRTGLDRVTDACGLSPFERAVLLLACGPDLVGAVASELADRTGVGYLTFGSALAVLPDAHWSALAPASGLRSWLLLAPEDPTRVITSRLVVDERVLHLVAGLDQTDDRVLHLARVVETPLSLPASLSAVAERLAAGWAVGPVRLAGEGARDGRPVAGAAAALARRPLFELAADDLPLDPIALRTFSRVCAREVRFGDAAFWIDLADAAPEASGRVERAFADTGWVAFNGGSVRSFEVPQPSRAERAALIAGALAEQGVERPRAELERVASAFTPTAAQADDLARDVAAGADLWESARRRTRADLAFAGLVEPRATWDDLVLPEPQLAQLRGLVAAVRRRDLVLDGWGFAARTRRGLGTSVLFAGPSGTGKTFAAEVVAHELGRDLLQVDLSQLVSKYIGETEKHLARVFDAAERSGAVLLFDESDALFGKRTEVRDSHDRYANLEIAYLLQRVERFQGLAILTSNARSGLDQAFLRRLTSIVTFPHPDAAARLALWQRAFPDAVPRGELDLPALARVDATGATIVAAALAAAYLAADAGVPVATGQVRTALDWELAKDGRRSGVL